MTDAFNKLHPGFQFDVNVLKASKIISPNNSKKKKKYKSLRDITLRKSEVNLRPTIKHTDDDTENKHLEPQQRTPAALSQIKKQMQEDHDLIITGMLEEILHRQRTKRKKIAALPTDLSVSGTFPEKLDLLHEQTTEQRMQSAIRWMDFLNQIEAPDKLATAKLIARTHYGQIKKCRDEYLEQLQNMCGDEDVSLCESNYRLTLYNLEHRKQRINEQEGLRRIFGIE